MSVDWPDPKDAFAAVQTAEGPVCGRKVKGKHYTMVPRTLRVDLERVLGSGKDTARARLVYHLLWTDPRFHGSGVFHPDIAGIGELAGVREREIRSALRQLHEARVVCWHARRQVIAVGDAPIWNVRSIQAAKNWQEEIARYGEIEPVSASAAMMGVFPNQQTAISNQQSATSAIGLASPTPSPGQTILIRLSDEQRTPLPSPYSLEDLKALVATGTEEQRATAAVAILLAAQRSFGRNIDREEYAFELALHRVQGGDDLVHLLRRVTVRLEEATRSGDGRWLAANACFGTGTKIAETTSGLTCKAFDDGDMPEAWGRGA